MNPDVETKESSLLLGQQYSEPHKEFAASFGRFGISNSPPHPKTGHPLDNESFQHDNCKMVLQSDNISLSPDCSSTHLTPGGVDKDKSGITRLPTSNWSLPLNIEKPDDRGSTNPINRDLQEQPDEPLKELTAAEVSNALFHCNYLINYDGLAKRLSDAYGFQFDELNKLTTKLSEHHDCTIRDPADYMSYSKTSLFNDIYHDTCKLAGKRCLGLPYLVLKLLDAERTLINFTQSLQYSSETCLEKQTKSPMARAIRCIFFIDLLSDFSNLELSKRRLDIYIELSNFLNTENPKTDKSHLKNDLLFFSPFIFTLLKHRNIHSIEKSRKYLDDHLNNQEKDFTTEVKSIYKLLFEMLFYKEKNRSKTDRNPETYKYLFENCESNFNSESLNHHGIWRQKLQETFVSYPKDLQPSFIKDDEIPGLKTNSSIQNLLIFARDKFNIDLPGLVEALGVTRRPKGCGVVDPVEETINSQVSKQLANPESNLEKTLYFKDRNAGFLLYLLLEAEEKVKLAGQQSKDPAGDKGASTRYGSIAVNSGNTVKSPEPPSLNRWRFIVGSGSGVRNKHSPINMHNASPHAVAATSSRIKTDMASTIKKEFVSNLFNVLETHKRRDLENKMVQFCEGNGYKDFIPYESLPFIDTPIAKAQQNPSLQSGQSYNGSKKK